MARKPPPAPNREPIRFEPDGKILSAFMQSQGEFDIIQGPIGSGKTDAAIMRLFAHASQQPRQRDGLRRSRFAIVRSTFPELKTTTIPSFCNLFPEGSEASGGFGEMSWSPPFTYHMRAGDIDAEFIFLALDKDDDIKKLRSLQLTGIYFNELQYINLLLVTEGLSRCGRYPSVKNGGCAWSGGIADMNAPESLHWAPIMFGKAPVPDHFTPDDVQRHRRPPGWNMFIQPPALLVLDDALKASGLEALNPGDEVEYCVNPNAENRRWLRPDYYPKKIHGVSRQWIDANCRNIAASQMKGKAVHPLFRSENERNSHVSPTPLKYNPALDLYVGMDFGLTPAVIFGQTIRGRVFVLGELYAEDVGAVSFAPVVKREILRRFPDIDVAKVIFIGDPGSAIRSQTDERTPYDIFRQNGMFVRPAPGANRFSNVGGRKEVVDNLLERQVDGYQALLIDPSARMLTQGLGGGYQFKVSKTSYGEFVSSDVVKNQYSHTCFVAGTPVSTPTGPVPIETLQPGDLVLTPQGTQRVAACMNRPATELVQVRLSDGRLVTCTPEHPFAVDGVRFVRADALQYNDLLVGESDSWADPRNIQSKSSTDGGTTDALARAAITAATLNMVAGICTASSGNITTAPSRPTTTSTTLTATQRTTRSRTWKRCTQRITRSITGFTTGLATKTAKRFWLPFGSKRPRLKSIPNIDVAPAPLQSSMPPSASRSNTSASGVQSSTGSNTATERRASVPCRAKGWRGRLLGWTTWNALANSAAQPSRPTSTPRSAIALRVVRVEPLRLYGSLTVYDLEVENEHVFYAGGVLVSNCDAFQYLLLGMGEGGNLLFGAGRNTAAVETKVQARVFDRGRRAQVFRR